MVNLPADVLLLIFSLLSQNDKLECMTVCRQWQRVLQHNLFQVIHIRNKDHFNYLVKRVKKDPILGTKVEQITISLKLDEKHDPTMFITLFPNVREFAIKNKTGFDNEAPFKTVQGLPWCENLTKITESSSSVYTKTLLHSGLCKSLTDLELAGQGDANSIIKSLANAPALKTLYLDGYDITFDDLELLHEMAPLLSSLSMIHAYFDVTPFPTDIKPATSMKKFQCISSFGFSDFNINNPHVFYASKKYTQLEELIVESCVLYRGASRDPDLREEQRELWKSYLKSLGLRLKPFSLSLVNFGLKHTTDFDFDLLDECGCQIKKLGLSNVGEKDTLEQLVNTTQGQYIQSLTLLLSSSYYFSFDWLLHFPVLKELVLDFPSVTYSGYSRGRLINLADMFECLNASPLDTLTINHAHFQNDEFGKSRTYPLLKNLVFFNCRFGEGVDACISRGFPNLKNLTLESCFQSIDHFMLPHTNLSHLQISNKLVHKNSSILVITQGNGQQRLYSTSKIFGASPSYRLGVYMTTFDLFTCTSKPFQKANDSPMLTVVCNSICDFNMKIESTYEYWRVFNIELLENTPLLTTLEFKCFTFTLYDLELLHSVVPTLRSILLKRCYIDCCPFPDNVEPATSVTSFRCESSDSVTFSEDLFYIEYVAEKYPNLEDLAFEICGVFICEVDKIEQELKHKEILVPYLTKLSTRLKSLSIDVSTDRTEFSTCFDFKILDDCGCQIERLELRDKVYISTLERLSMTHQAKYIQSLTVYKMAYNPGSTDDTFSLQWLSRFTKLKELTLEFPDRLHSNRNKYQLNLPDLCDHLVKTKVETLRIENVELRVEKKNEPCVYPSINNLFLHEVEFQWHTDVLMARALPNLKSLTLNSCLENRRLFAFPNLKLSYLQISQVNTNGPLHVLVITVDDDQQRLYTVNKAPITIGVNLITELKDISSMPPVTSVPYDDSAESPFATIVCKSLSQFFMMKYFYQMDL